MKVALCFYGKFSGTNSRGEPQGFEIPYEYLKNNVITEDTDIFFHGWNDDDIASENLIKLYKPKRCILEPQISFNHPYQHYDFVPSGPWNTKSYLNANYSRFYSMKTAVSLVDESYDLVLVSRFDNMFLTKVDFSLLKPENFYISHWNLLAEGWGYNDAWFIAGQKHMKEFSLIYDRLDEYFDIENNSGYFKFLKEHNMTEINITSPHAICKYRVVETGLLDSVYAYGLEYKSWKLLRRMHENQYPWGIPLFDITVPLKVKV